MLPKNGFCLSLAMVLGCTAAVVSASSSESDIKWESSLDYQQFPNILSLCGPDNDIECPDKEYYRSWAILGIWDDFEGTGRLKTVLWAENAPDDDVFDTDIMEPDKILFECRVGSTRIKPEIPRLLQERENEYGGTDHYLPSLQWKFDEGQIHKGSPRYHPERFVSRIRQSHTLVVREQGLTATSHGEEYRFDLDGSYRALAEFEKLCKSAEPPE